MSKELQKYLDDTQALIRSIDKPVVETIKLSKLEKAVGSAVDEIEIVLKSEGRVLSRTVEKLNGLMPSEKIVFIAPEMGIEITEKVSNNE